jgi:hypothetical protein
MTAAILFSLCCKNVNVMKYYHTIDSEEFRNLILTPKEKQIECNNCKGTGWENWDENGDDIRVGRSYSSKRVDGECQDCKGIGYVF